jgi:hypothetical protein
MNKKSITVALAVALAAGAPVASAGVTINGFGQVIAGTTGDDTDTMPERNFNSDVDFKEESLFAVQISADINERVDVVGQLLARGYNDFDAELAWAYAAIKFDSGWNLKVGRQRTPFYRYSDFLDVGYAHPWVRTPLPVYNTPWSNMDGLGLSRNRMMGENWFSQFQIQYGEYRGDARFGGTIYDGTLKDFWGLSWDMEYKEWLSFRAAYFTAETSLDGTSLDQLSAVLVSSGLSALASRMDYQQDKGEFRNLGFKAERNAWMLVGEYTLLTLADSIVSDKKDWYLSGAWRFGNLQPSITVGHRKADPVSEVYAGIPTTSPLFPTIFGAVQSDAYDDRYYGLGLRWDFASNIAFKADYTRFSSDTDVRFTSRDGAGLISAGLVFTF